jgi:signal recognition particle subunit SRP54
MVLNTLGSQLSAALAKLNKSVTVDEELLKAVLKDVSSALLEADVNVRLVATLRKNVADRVKVEDDAAFNKARMVERAVVDELVRMLSPPGEPWKPKKGASNVVMFVGLQGAGKTTTVAKYAHYYQSRKWKVAMVCADTFRAGAFDQLKQNATRVRVPFYGSYTEADPVKIAAEGVEQFRREGYEIIIVDTSGRHKQETALFAEMEQVAAAVKPDDIVFAMDSSIGQAAEGQAAAFKASVPVGSVIITKLDGHAKGGGALSAVAATGSPIIFIGTGEHFDDLTPFDPHGFIGKLLGRGDMKGLLTEFKEKGILDAQSEVMERMARGKFTLRDMYEQFEQIMSLGPISKLMDAMPGNLGAIMSQLPGGAAGGQEGNARLKRFLCIMDSMTPAELDGDVEMDEPRMIRVARGTGVHPQEVLALMQAFKQMSSTVSKMSKSGLLKGGDAKLQQAMSRNPQAVLAQLQKSMDPRMLQQLGGAGNMMNMLKQMGPGGPGAGAPGGGGLADMLGGLMGGGGGPAAGGAGGGGGAPNAAAMRQMMKSMGLG